MAFKHIQQTFIDYIKNPLEPLPVGTDARHMQVYRDLFYNNIYGFVSNAFPVLKSLYGPNDWGRVVDKFFQTHDCQSPIFVDIAGEFMHFLQQQDAKYLRFPFELELAHYEWQELVVAVASNEDSQNVLQADELAQYLMMLAGFTAVVSYQYPVHKISPDFLPQAVSTPAHNFCIYRDIDDEVQFLQLTPLAAQALFLLKQHSYDLRELSAAITALYPNIASDIIYSGLTALLTPIAAMGILRKTHAVN